MPKRFVTKRTVTGAMGRRLTGRVSGEGSTSGFFQAEVES